MFLPSLPVLLCSEPVHETVGHTGLACPGVDGGALLAGPHVSHSGLVPQVAHFRLVAPRGTILQISDHLYGWSLVSSVYLVITTKRFEVLNVVQRCWVSENISC